MPGALAPCRVLVVEDEEPIRETLREALELEGYAVHTADGGRAALAHLGEACPDVVLLDLMMPGVNGWDVLRYRGEAGICPDVPVVLLSAYHDLEATAREHGVRAFLAKPFELDALLALVERLRPPRPGA